MQRNHVKHAKSNSPVDAFLKGSLSIDPQVEGGTHQNHLQQEEANTSAKITVGGGISTNTHVPYVSQYHSLWKTLEHKNQWELRSHLLLRILGPLQAVGSCRDLLRSLLGIPPMAEKNDCRGKGKGAPASTSTQTSLRDCRVTIL